MMKASNSQTVLFVIPSGFEKTEAENISPIKWKAEVILSARKKIHAKTVNANVMIIDSNSLNVGYIRPCATMSRLFLLLLNRIDGKMNNAFKNPQAMNVQFAPC